MTALASTLDDLRKKIFVECPSSLKPHLEMIESKTKVNIEYFVLGLGLLLAILVFANIGASFISAMVGSLYPAYDTIKHLEGNKKDEHTLWLAYWVIFGTVSVCEMGFKWIVQRIPLYYPIKITFLLWCMLPQYKGSIWVYDNIVKPYVVNHISKLDAALSSSDPQAKVNAADKTK
jgi:receptor expression-enhancing protein 5/6